MPVAALVAAAAEVRVRVDEVTARQLAVATALRRTLDASQESSKE